MEVVKYVKEMMNVEEGSVLDIGLDMALDQAPMVGKALQTMKFVRLERRFNKHERQFMKVKSKVEESENETLYKEQVFPFIVEQVLNDDEDVKTKIIIDGLEHMVDKNIFELERVFHYYDVLRELRMADIYLLADQYYPYDLRLDRNLRVNFNLYTGMSHEEKQLAKNAEVFQINKLVRLGLLSEETKIEPSRYDEEEVIRPKISHKLSGFGRDFIIFFSIRDVDRD